MSSRAAVTFALALGASMSLADAQPQAPATPPAAVMGDESASDRPARDAWLAGRIQELTAAYGDLAEARVGIRVEDVDTGRVIYEQNAAEPYSVASNAKVITAAAALARLGPGFQYRTSVLAEDLDAKGVVRGDLFVRGRGDPGLGTDDLTRLADDLALAGVKRVRGDLVIDDSYFDSQVLPPHFDEQPEEQAAFRAPVAALSLDFNAFAVVVRPALSGRGPAVVAIDPPSDYVRVTDNRLITQRSGRDRVFLTTRAVDDHMEVEISGQIRAGSEVRRFRRRVEDPALYAGSVLRELLARRRVRVRGQIRRGATPDTARTLASVASEPLSLLVHGLGKYSNNFVAETLLKTLGAETRPADTPEPATWEHGLEAVQGFLVDEVGLEAGSFRYGNGSGLFDATALSPAQLVRVLARARRDPRYGPDLSSSLSIAGEDGTLRYRMKNSPARGHVRGKTGTLAQVSSLCGYAAVDGMRPLAFAIAINDIPATWRARHQARRFQDRVADALVSYLDRDR